MVSRTKRAVNKFLRWVVGASRKVIRAVTHPFSLHQLSTKYPEANREYYKDCSFISLYNFLFKLGRSKRSVLGKEIKSFIESTKTSEETDPVVLMTNIRQFMNSMKNYIVANGGVKFEKEVSKAKVNAPKPFHLDEILENVFCELILMPLKTHLDDVIYKIYSRSVSNVMEQMYHIRMIPLSEIKLKAYIQSFSEEELTVLSKNFYSMQVSDLPSEKFKHLRAGLSNINKFAKSYNIITGKKEQIQTDNLIPLLAWVFAQCRTFTCEVEGIYMWYLMNPSLRNSECGRYITMMLCASSLLNEPDKLIDDYDSVDSCHCCDCEREQKKEIKVVILDEFNGLPIGTEIFPSQPNIKAKDICSAMARKLCVKYPEFYRLYALIDGKEHILSDNDRLEQIQESVKKFGRRKSCMFLYKETTRKLRWPFLK